MKVCKALRASNGRIVRPSSLYHPPHHFNLKIRRPHMNLKLTRHGCPMCVLSMLRGLVPHFVWMAKAGGLDVSHAHFQPTTSVVIASETRLHSVLSQCNYPNVRDAPLPAPYSPHSSGLHKRYSTLRIPQLRDATSDPLCQSPPGRCSLWVLRWALALVTSSSRRPCSCTPAPRNTTSTRWPL